MKVILIGASGQLGTDFKKIIPASSLGPLTPNLQGSLASGSQTPSQITGEIKLIELNYPDFDITKKNEVKIRLEQLKPDIVINTSAYNLVDRAEEFPEEAMAVNYYAVENLATVCRSLGSVLVHYSTDYVFGADQNRTRPYTEDDLAAPVSKYGESKFKGEQAIQKIKPKFFIIRTSGLFGQAGSQGKGGNFIESIIKKAEESGELKVVDDQVLTPTYTLDLAKNSWELMQTNNYGLYHITSEGQCSWYDFTRAVFRHLNLPNQIIPVKTNQYKLKARRPHYSVLANKNLNKLGLNIMRHWESTIPDYLREKKYI